MRSICLPLMAITALTLPVLGLAKEAHCEFSAPRNLTLDLAGVRSVVFETNEHDLRLTGSSDSAGQLTGRACAAKETDLANLTISQSKRGDVLTVTLRRQGTRNWSFGKSYAYLALTGTLPASSQVRIDDGSGDVEVSNVASLGLNVGSGDVKVRGVRGAVSGSLGSGDLDLQDIGSVALDSIGSGDIDVADARGDVSVDSIGSGDLSVSKIQGSLKVGNVGSGDVNASDIAGSVSVGAIGSGDVDARRIGGDVTVRSKGSGDVTTEAVSGKVSKPRD
ncbi:MAG: DUF4097 family beta strand repeat-containing protein [Pseudoxanthomonas sp.]